VMPSAQSRAGLESGSEKAPVARGLAVFLWGYLDLNQGPLPYQGVDLAALVALQGR
jgi:hypothetical protein